MTNEEMEIKAFYEALELFKTSKEFAHDKENIHECEYHLSNYNYQEAYSFVQKLLREYETSMNSISDFNSGLKSIATETAPNWTDFELKSKLKHFHDYIPAYAFARESKKEISKQIIFGLVRGVNS